MEKLARTVDIESLGARPLGSKTVTRDSKTGEIVKRVRHLDVSFPVKHLVSARMEIYGCPMKVDPETKMVDWDVETAYVRSIMVGKISLWRHLKYWWRSLGK